MKYAAVLFDFDYTLGDATQSIYMGYSYGLTELGYEAASIEEVRATVGMKLEDGFTRLTGNPDPEKRKEFSRLFREKAHPIQHLTTPLFPGCLELFDYLREENIPTGVVSTKDSHVLEKILTHDGLTPYLEFIIGSDQVKNAKPAPDGILWGAGRLGLSLDQILYCGDTVIDAEAAKNAGCHFCAVLNGTTPREAFENWPKDYVAEDLFELKSFLSSNKM